MYLSFVHIHSIPFSYCAESSATLYNYKRRSNAAGSSDGIIILYYNSVQQL